MHLKGKVFYRVQESYQAVKIRMYKIGNLVGRETAISIEIYVFLKAMAKPKGWIKVNDWRHVQFPDVCPFSGLKVDTTRVYVVENTSVFWIFMRLLRWGQYIKIDAPFNETGLKN